MRRFMETSDSNVSFHHVPTDKITKAIKILGSKKLAKPNDIANKLIKSVSGFSSDHIYITFNKCIKDGEYVRNLKKEEVRPLSKKDGIKKNCYRPVGILSNISKVYEWCLYDQIYDFFENKFSRYQC